VDQQQHCGPTYQLLGMSRLASVLLTNVHLNAVPVCLIDSRRPAIRPGNQCRMALPVHRHAENAGAENDGQLLSKYKERNTLRGIG